METNQALIASIEAFDIDGGTVKTSFADRLAEEQGWSPEFTDRVIREYKRFVALAMISETPVTPSLIIDEAWHLHLIYTRSYWERFTPLLPKPLHHEPTTGGESEDTKHKIQFGATLELYEQTFGEEAPGDIWLGKQAKPERSQISNSQRLLTWSLVAASAFFLAGCTALSQVETSLPLLIPGLFFVGIVVILILGFSAAAQGRRNRPPNGNCSASGGGCESSTVSDSGSSHGGHCSGGGHCSSSGGDGGGSSCGGGGCGGGGD